jgi:hypothetical protein
MSIFKNRRSAFVRTIAAGAAVLGITGAALLAGQAAASAATTRRADPGP